MGPNCLGRIGGPCSYLPNKKKRNGDLDSVCLSTYVRKRSEILRESSPVNLANGWVGVISHWPAWIPHNQFEGAHGDMLGESGSEVFDL